MSVTAPVFRCDEEWQERAFALLRDGARRIRERLGD
jgi:hypothetical protein